MGCCFKKPEYRDMGECFDVRQKRYDDYYRQNKVLDSDFYDISLVSMKSSYHR